jgi:hypothetical protein
MGRKLSLVITAWRVLRLLMEKASRCVCVGVGRGELRIQGEHKVSDRFQIFNRQTDMDGHISSSLTLEREEHI